MKIAHVVGNRPQFIKLALLHDELQKRAPGSDLIVHTGQHFDADMSAIFFGQLRIPSPDYQLHVHRLSHNEMIGNMLIKIDPILATERPDCVIVYGDTNTTLAGALAAKKRNIRLAHIESGIRTGKEDMPEESNRYLADRLATWNFACTPGGLENLEKEGFGTGGSIPSAIHHCGDLLLDAALRFGEQASRQSAILSRLQLEGKPFILATIHRAENAEDAGTLQEIVRALDTLHARIPVIFPMHPKTKKALAGFGIITHFISTPPLGYMDMLALVRACQSVVTDSGGLSREAFFFHKPVLVLMQNPFWPELFTHGQCLQAAASTEDILAKHKVLESGDKPFHTELFGDGRAAARIAGILLNELTEKEGPAHA
jgi:UDP-GlcNAc3NAcA epimerase